MPATISINLLGQEDLSHSPGGRIVQWAMTYGRYIMILTEIVVLAAFVSRFSLDRKLTDLKEEITQKQAIIEANSELEQNIRTLQSQLERIKNLFSGQSQPIEAINLMQSALPLDVYLESLDYRNNAIAIKGTALTTEGFAHLIANLRSINKFSGVDIGMIQKLPQKGIEFEITANISVASKPDGKKNNQLSK